MRKYLYFVEFGNYSVETDVTDKLIYPVRTNEELNVNTAEDRLKHLMQILKKNCVVSISEFNETQFENVYNMETGTLIPYEPTFILIRSVNGYTDTKGFAEFESARKAMVDDLLESMDDEDAYDDYEEFSNYRGEYESDEFTVRRRTAWAGPQANKYGDWMIIVC